MRNSQSRRPGGRSRRNDNRGNRPGNSSQHTRSKTEIAPKAEGFFQRLLRFFTGASKPKTSSPSSSRASKTDQQPGRRSSGSGESRRQVDSGAVGRHKPENVEVTSPKLYVGNLSYEATETDLIELFNGVGKVQNAEVVSNRHTTRSKGFAFVEMQSIAEAQRAVEVLHDQEFLGRKLVVSGAKSAGVAA